MSFHHNPFSRGYWNFHVRRVLEILRDGNPPRWLPLHPAQAHFPDRDLMQKPCVLCNGYVLGGTTETLDAELTACCNLYGYEKAFVTDVRYTILADDEDRSVCLGEVHSREEADEIIHRLAFRAGFCRCWEISAAHLEPAAVDYLQGKAEDAGPLLSVFSIAGGRIGIRLTDTPWDDSTLGAEYDTSAAELCLAYLEHGMPLSLVRILHQAGEADVPVLIFAHDAPRLDGLPTYEPD
jgi:hypothetical protein